MNQSEIPEVIPSPILPQEDQVYLANSQRYAQTDEVEGYLKRRYHALRLALAVEQVKKETTRTFPALQPAQITVLELASASGQAALRLKEAGYNVIASDIESGPLAKAREAGLTCVQFDVAQTFPFADDSIQALLMGELIEHIFDTDKLISECNRVLCDNGVLVLTTPNLARWQDRLLFLFGRAPRQIDSLHSYLRLHIRPFTASLLKEVLRQKGFTVSRICSNYVVLDTPSGKRLESRFLARLFPTFGGSLIVTARKVRSVSTQR